MTVFEMKLISIQIKLFSIEIKLFSWIFDCQDGSLSRCMLHITEDTDFTEHNQTNVHQNTFSSDVPPRWGQHLNELATPIQGAAEKKIAEYNAAMAAKETKERLRELGQKIRRSKVYCNCKRIVPPAEHKENCKIRCAYTARTLFEGADSITRSEYDWFLANGGGQGCSRSFPENNQGPKQAIPQRNRK